MFDFTGRRFVVTGASSGIGRRVAFDLAERGAEVLALARRPEPLNALRDTFPERIQARPCDVLDFEALGGALEAFCAEGKVHGSVHAAGINRMLPLRVFDWDEADAVIRTSLHAGLELIRVLARKKMSETGASHVQIASVMAQVGQVGFAPYSAAKSGILGAVRSLALELASRGGRVNAVCPGWVSTEMTEQLEAGYPGGREAIEQAHPLGLGTVEDVSASVLFLLSDHARWITGTGLMVDGGYTIR